MKILEFEDNKVQLYVNDPAFLELKKRDSTPTKSRFYKEMMYIYQVVDYNSRANREGYDELHAHEYAIDAAGLTKPFVLDNLLKNAIVAYFEIRDTAPIKYIKALHHSMNNGTNIVKQLNKINDKLLSVVESKDIMNSEVDEKTLREAAITISEIAKNQKLLFDLASEAQDQIVKLERLYERLKVEEEKEEKGMGGDSITESMMPE